MDTISATPPSSFGAPMMPVCPDLQLATLSCSPTTAGPSECFVGNTTGSMCSNVSQPAAKQLQMEVQPQQHPTVQLLGELLLAVTALGVPWHGI